MDLLRTNHLLVALFLLGFYSERAICGYQSYGRQCYSCSSGADTSWDSCRSQLLHHTAAQEGIASPLCYANCYTRVGKSGDVARGCYQGEEGVNPALIGCYMQSGSMYCFCEGNKCNFEQAPTQYAGAPAAPIFNADNTVYVKNAANEEYAGKKPSYHDLINSDDKFSQNHVGDIKPREVSHVTGSQPYLHSEAVGPKYRPNRLGGWNGQQNAHTNQKRDRNQFSMTERKGRVNHNSGSQQEIVHGVDAPPVYLVRNGKVINLTDKSSDRHNYQGNNIEHEVEVHTSRDNSDQRQNINNHQDPYNNRVHQREDQNEQTREYVDHIQRQRHLETKQQTGTDDHRYAKIGPDGKPAIEPLEPQLEHTQTQHFHTYNVGDRTIEHHIVEHYVLHHRIKEHLKNKQGIDAKNVDPRTVSLIYQLLHPQKANQIRREKAGRKALGIEE